MDILNSLNAQGRTIVMVPHDPVVARRASRVIRFLDGRIASDERNGHDRQPVVTQDDQPVEIETNGTQPEEAHDTSPEETHDALPVETETHNYTSPHHRPSNEVQNAL